MQTDDLSCIEGSPLLDDTLLASLGLDEVVPASLAAWRPLVVAGLSFFLEKLPAERLTAILAEQMALAENAPPSSRLVALISHCPTLHKLGQVLARHRSLDPELRQHLQTLESLPSTQPFGPLAARIRGEIGEVPDLAIADYALAEGSVAVVIPFSYQEEGKERHGVFKVLKPGIEATLTEELALLDDVASFLEQRGRVLALPSIDYRDSLKNVQLLLAQEIRLDIEQRNLEAAAKLYRNEPAVLIPRLLPWCTPRITAMERIFGTKVTSASLSGTDRRLLAGTMISALLAKPFWSGSEEAIFHGDLHGGNLFVTEDGRLAVLDWSLTASLAKADREALLAIALGGLTLDARKIRQAIAGLTNLDENDSLLAEVVSRSLDRLVRGGGLPGFHWLLALLDQLATSTMVGFRGEFALFRKTWLSLSGVISDLMEDHSPDTQLLTVGIREFLAELPARWVAYPFSRRFSTHVSNVDIVQIWASSGLAFLRYWTRLLSLSAPESIPDPVQ